MQPLQVGTAIHAQWITRTTNPPRLSDHTGVITRIGGSPTDHLITIEIGEYLGKPLHRAFRESSLTRDVDIIALPVD